MSKLKLQFLDKINKKWSKCAATPMPVAAQLKRPQSASCARAILHSTTIANYAEKWDFDWCFLIFLLSRETRILEKNLEIWKQQYFLAFGWSPKQLQKDFSGGFCSRLLKIFEHNSVLHCIILLQSNQDMLSL